MQTRPRKWMMWMWWTYSHFWKHWKTVFFASNTSLLRCELKQVRIKRTVTKICLSRKIITHKITKILRAFNLSFKQNVCVCVSKQDTLKVGRIFFFVNINAFRIHHLLCLQMGLRYVVFCLNFFLSFRHGIPI